MISFVAIWHLSIAVKRRQTVPEIAPRQAIDLASAWAVPVYYLRARLLLGGDADRLMSCVTC